MARCVRQLSESPAAISRPLLGQPSGRRIQDTTSACSLVDRGSGVSAASRRATSRRKSAGALSCGMNTFCRSAGVRSQMRCWASIMAWSSANAALITIIRPSRSSGLATAHRHRGVEVARLAITDGGHRLLLNAAIDRRCGAAFKIARRRSADRKGMGRHQEDARQQILMRCSGNRPGRPPSATGGGRKTSVRR